MRIAIPATGTDLAAREDAEQHSPSITTPQEVRSADIRIQMP